MNWYYADAGKPVGPIPEAEFASLIRSGTIKGDTLVWREGMATWQPYASVQAASAGAGEGVSSTPGAPAEPKADVGAGAGGTSGGGFESVFDNAAQSSGYLSTDELLARDYDVQIQSSFGRSWELFTERPGSAIGVTALIGFLILVVSVIPYLGIILSIFFVGPLAGGLWLFFIKRTRGEAADVNDGFGGFGSKYGSLVLANFVPGLLTMLCVLPFIAVAAGIFIPFMISVQRGGGMPPDAPVLLVVGGVVVLLACLIVGIFLKVIWFFTLPLVADKGLDFWTAMGIARRVVMKHFWSTLWLMILCWLLFLLGTLFCLVGLLVTAPFAIGALAAHYQRVFGDLAPRQR
ncbi:MAG: DUF4339 domain-containing protein [Pedosphaera sp.]|nr:DUF4339 domain-containing protein [Pedosphaera sp.]